jgi:hypothetical protein
MKYPILITLVFIFLFTACEEGKEQDNLLVFINPEEGVIEVNSQEFVSFRINSESESIINQVKINVAIDNKEIIELLDSVPNQSSFFYTFDYYTTLCAEISQLKFSFEIIDSQSNIKKLVRMIKVLPKEQALVESTGHVFYSYFSGRADAFNIKDKEALIGSLHADEKLFIQDDTTSRDDINSLSGKWISPSGGKFLKFNQLDYANASYNDAKKVFDSGSPLEFADNLSDGDIIIEKLNGEYYIIRLVQLIDKEGTNKDCYYFNVKQRKKTPSLF